MLLYQSSHVILSGRYSVDDDADSQFPKVMIYEIFLFSVGLTSVFLLEEYFLSSSSCVSLPQSASSLCVAEMKPTVRGQYCFFVRCLAAIVLVMALVGWSRGQYCAYEKDLKPLECKELVGNRPFFVPPKVGAENFSEERRDLIRLLLSVNSELQHLEGRLDHWRQTECLWTDDGESGL